MIIIYSTETCPYCKIAKKYMDSKDLKYVNKSVDKDKDALNEMVKKSGQMGVPVIDIDGSIIVGFDKEMIDKLTKKEK